jgi:hypothetical protein
VFAASSRVAGGAGAWCVGAGGKTTFGCTGVDNAISLGGGGAFFTAGLLFFDASSVCGTGVMGGAAVGFFFRSTASRGSECTTTFPPMNWAFTSTAKNTKKAINAIGYRFIISLSLVNIVMRYTYKFT